MGGEATNNPQNGPSFKEKIQQEKRSTRENNIQNTTFDPEVVDNYFKSIGGDLTYESIRELFKKLGKEGEERILRADGLVPNIINDETDKIVVNEISSVFEALPSNKKTPEILVETIARYIKSHMKYDVITAMNLIPGIQANISSECEELTDKLKMAQIQVQPEILNNYLSGEIDKDKFIADTIVNQSFIGISDFQLSQLTALFEEVITPNKDKIKGEEAKNLINSLEQQVKFKNIQGIIDLLKDNTELLRSLMLIQLDTNSQHTLDLKGEYTMYQLLKEIKVGACRHYSAISKKIYEQCSDLIPGNKESELLYVLNQNGSHAYNVLMTEQEDGSISKKYIDITSYINGSSLWTNKNSMYGSKNELFVENSSDPDKSSLPIIEKAA